MPGKVAKEATITNKDTKKETKEEVKPRQATNEELVAQIAGEAVRASMKEFMPMFGNILRQVADQKQTPVNATVKVQEDYRSVQSKVIDKINRNFDDRMRRNKRFLEKMYRAPKSDYVVMRIPRVYAKYFGSELPVGLNGSVIQVPVNGQPFRVHKDFVPIINQALEYKDQKISFMEDTNFEDVAEVPEGSLSVSGN
jgi:hypothetical protein